MAKKVEIRKNIKKTLQNINFMINDCELNNIDIISLKNNSSDEFANSSARMLEHFLIIIILISFSYYKVKHERNEISFKIQMKLNEIKETIIKQIATEDPTEIEIKFIQYITQKFDPSLKREIFKKQKAVQFDSISQKHISFLGNPIPIQNIVLKLKGSGSEKAQIRIGLTIKENTVTITDIIKRGNAEKNKKH